ncbi:YcaO-like family protein [Gemmobacter aquaticus]|uniref:YcaO-like family protein n=1 Tax=Gemmobacter aquaticus TaxID=490185 RepID=UPI0011B5177C|nr:YcaO-like family protein [Gemmobacter aquaticus]
MPSPWAAGLAVAFARWNGEHPAISDLATGTGPDAASACARALGEMAENLSIGAGSHPQPVPAIGRDGKVIVADSRMLIPAGSADPGSEGVAAGETMAEAKIAALYERIERAAYALWWGGGLAARKAHLPTPLLRQYRQAQTQRRSMLWHLPLMNAVTICLVLTDDGQCGQIAMGTAAHSDPHRAADAALREALQAEIAWLAPPHHPDVVHRDAMHAALRSRLPVLLGAGRTVVDRGGDGDPLLRIEAELVGRGLDWGYADLTAAGIGVPVVRCVIPGWPLARPILMSPNRADGAAVTQSLASFAYAAAVGG